ncbi:MAG TPA: MMPL family transporter, partial [Thermoleophilaceae bacterium]|nr:MMPL family transporter [Thermoleophilaceae bacterium]
MSTGAAEREARRTAAGRVARAIVFLRYPLVIGWIAAVVASTLFLPDLREAQSGSLGDLVPSDADAIEVEERSFELFGFPLLSRTLVVHRDSGGLSLGQQREAVDRALALNRGAVPELEGIAGALVATNTLGEPPFSRESSTTAITYLFFPPDIGQNGRTELAERLVDTRVDAEPDATTGVTGTVPARDAQGETIAGALPLVEAATILLVVLAVGLHFRAVGAPLLNLLTVGIAYLTALRVIAYAGQLAGLSVPSEVEPIIVVLLFGVITDYSIFFMSRFRQVSEEGEPRRQAAERATRELLPIVVTAGLTIIGGSATLALAQLGFLQAFGPGMALSVGIGLIVAITFVPAALAIFGSLLFRPGPRAREEEDRAPRPRRRRFGRRPPRVDHPPRRGLLPFRRRPPRVSLPRGRRSIPIELANRFPVTVAILSAAVLVVAASGLLRL